MLLIAELLIRHLNIAEFDVAGKRIERNNLNMEGVVLKKEYNLDSSICG